MGDLPTSYNSLLDWLSVRAAEQADLVERVDTVAQAFVQLASAAFRGDLAGELKSLFAKLRYLVLNIPSHLSAAEERIFIAVLRPLDPADTYAWDDVPSASSEPAGRVHVLDTSGDGDEFRQTIESWWHFVWSEYASITQELSQNGALTWNQYLLHGCEQPRPLGLIWHGLEKRNFSYYVRVPREFKEEFDLPDAGAEEMRKWNAAISKLPKSPSAFPNPDNALVDELARMGPVAGVDIRQTASAATYHLLRSYARWGGSAFLSIPVPLAARVHAALSLCSDGPIEEYELGQWRGIAGTVFPYLAASDLISEFNFTQAKLDEVDREGVAWAHDVKNFTAPVHADLMDVRRRIVGSVRDEKAIAALERATDSVLILNAAAHARQLAGEASRMRRSFTTAPMPSYALPVSVAVPVVKLALEYLLETHREQISLRDKGRFDLQWDRETRTRTDMLVELAKHVVPGWESVHPSLLSSSVLGHPSVIWPLAVLREVVQNIRMLDPVPGSEIVRLSYSVALLDKKVTVRLQQEQVDGMEWKSGNVVEGLKKANDLYGETGAAVGDIKIVDLTCSPSPPVRGQNTFCIRYVVEVRLWVANSNQEVVK